MRQLIRGTCLLAHILTGLAISILLLLNPLRAQDAPILMSWWCRSALRILHIDYRINGSPPEGPRLTVANHISWLDILLIGASQATRFVAKAEVATWPIVGWLAQSTGTLFIRRGRSEPCKLATEIATALERNGNITLFPEGKTTAGEQAPRFYARLFATAIQTQTPIQPVAIRYGRSASGGHIAPFLGDDTLLAHLMHLLGERRLMAEISFLQPIDSQDKSRQYLAAESADCIAKALAQPRVNSAEPGGLQASSH